MIPERLRQLRESHHLSQYALANKVHITRSTYSSYETGRRLPSLDVLVILARFFNTSTDYILGFAEDPDRPPALDGKAKELLRLFQSVGPQSQDVICDLVLREQLSYNASRSNSPEPPASPALSSSEIRR